MDDQSLRQIITSVCERPNMYTFRSSFATSSAFISGYAWGRGGTDLQQMKDFREWLAQRFYDSHGLPRNYGREWYIDQIYPSDPDAYTALPVLFAEFLDVRN